MSIYDGQPDNPNFLSPANYTFLIQKLPVLSSLITKVSIPGISLGTIKSPTTFRALQVPGNPLTFTEFNVTYKLDESLQAYTTLTNWLVGLGIPDTFQTYADLNAQPIANGKYSDASLTFLDSSKNPTVTMNFSSAFPVSASGFSMETSVNDIQYVEQTISFAFQSLKIETAS